MTKPRKTKRILPDNYDYIGHIIVPRKVERTKGTSDPLLNIIDKPKVQGFVNSTWTEEAYTKSFEKFEYGESRNVLEIEPELAMFADNAVITELSYFANSQVIPVQFTEKNMDSTPAFPKMMEYDTEKDYISENGMSEYIKAQTDPETLKREPLWWCFLKNEILKEKKVKENDIRIISCTDPVFTRLGATLDQDQNSRMKERTENKHAQVGWTPFRGGIDRRLKRISRGKDKFVELDWTRFDGTIPRWLFLRVRFIRWFFMNKSDRSKYMRMSRWYAHRLTNRLTLFPTGEVTRIKKGNPSGQYSTTVDNNIVNEWLTAFEFAYLHRRTHGKLPTVDEYRRNVDFLCYGDDRILAYKSGFVNYDTNEVITMYKNLFGMWVKPENIKVTDTLVGTSFCGFTFFKKHSTWVGVMNVNKILQSLKTPTKQLPDLESLWGKLVSLRILTQHSDPEQVSYLNRQIKKVEEYAQAEGINLPEIGPDFYEQVW